LHNLHAQSVHLIWVSSNLDPIRDWFPAQLRALREMGAPFELHLHDTGAV
jgi:hypothetical protein